MKHQVRQRAGAILAIVLVVGTCAAMLASRGPAVASSYSGQVLNACEADGATVRTAMSAFIAQNPGLTVTATDLVSKSHSGPYIEDWPSNLDFYDYTIEHGKLYLMAAGSSPPWTHYIGPTSCARAGVGNSKNWLPINVRSVLQSCQADGATVRVAMEAFVAQNPGVAPTPFKLTGHAYGGPYIQSWPHAAFYTYWIKRGVLYVQGASTGTPFISFTGPSSCRVVGL
ncbi:MAG: hypothetical protein ACHQFZ_04270 [Acidimicrobiales bacterium]